MSIAQSVIDIVKDEMARNNAAILRSVDLKVGSMSCIVPESLISCFEIMISGTEFEGARLNIEVMPLMAYCNSCDKEFEIKDSAFYCTNCGEMEIDILSGRDLSISEIEVD